MKSISFIENFPLKIEKSTIFCVHLHISNYLNSNHFLPIFFSCILVINGRIKLNFAWTNINVLKALKLSDYKYEKGIFLCAERKKNNFYLKLHLACFSPALPHNRLLNSFRTEIKLWLEREIVRSLQFHKILW